MNNNLMYNSIDTDRDLSIILGNFSPDTIENSVREALSYKFTPYGNRKPNFPYVINQYFESIRNNSSLGNDEYITDKEYEIYYNILGLICNAYNLQIAAEIPHENLYSLVYTMYQILVSEFTDRMLVFFSNYIVSNKDYLLKSIPDNKKIDKKSTYTKKMYNDSSIVGIYENMESIIDIVAMLDIPFVKLMEHLSSQEVAQFISTYIIDVGDIYKYHYSKYIFDKITRTDMITSIKIRFMNITQNNMAITQENNPFIV